MITKRLYLSFLLIVLNLFQLFSQETYYPDTLVIFGADFRLAKIVTDHKYNSTDVLKIDIPKLNSEIIRTAKIYSKNFRSKTLLFDTTSATANNTLVDTKNLFKDERHVFSGGDIKVRELIKDYEHESQGYGLLFVIEKIDELDHRESFYIVMFDLQTKKVVHCDKVETGLSRVKDQFNSGWFSWRTGLVRIIQQMNSVYNFWYNYPEQEPVSLFYEKAKAPKLTPTVIEEEKVKKPGVKGQKILSVYGAYSLLGDNLERNYAESLRTKYGQTNVYSVDRGVAMPKINISFDYGFAPKHSVGLSAGMDKGRISWRDSVSGDPYFQETWRRKQLAIRYDYYIVAAPYFNLFSGLQVGYNSYKRDGPVAASNIVIVAPSPLSIGLNIGMSFIIKTHFFIQTSVGLGGGSNDIITLGAGYRFK